MTAYTPVSAVSFRPARASGDDAALARLARLDSKPALTGTVVVAERDGELVAALSLETGAHVADPFRPTADVVALLELHADRLRREHGARRRRSSRRTALRARLA